MIKFAGLDALNLDDSAAQFATRGIPGKLVGQAAQSSLARTSGVGGVAHCTARTHIFATEMSIAPTDQGRIAGRWPQKIKGRSG